MPQGTYFLVLLTFFLRLFPAFYFFGSSELTGVLEYFEGSGHGQAPESHELLGIPTPLVPIYQLVFLCSQTSGLPLVFWLKFPGILADVAITLVIHSMAFRARLDKKRAVKLALLFAVNPVSIIATSFVGGNTSVGLACFLASFYFCFTARRFLLSTILFGASIAIDNIYIVCFPIFLLKIDDRPRLWLKGLSHIALSVLFFHFWGLSNVFTGYGFSNPLEFLYKPGNEPAPGLSLLLKVFSVENFPLPLSKLLANAFSGLQQMSGVYISYFPALFISMLFLLCFFHRKHNPFQFTGNILLLPLALNPFLKPYQLLIALPFIILNTNKAAKYFFSAVSLFLISRYSIIAFDSGTFQGKTLLLAQLSNVTLYKENWFHWLFIFTGYVAVPFTLLACLFLSLLTRSWGMDHIKIIKMGLFPLFLTWAVVGGWLFFGGVTSIKYFKNNKFQEKPRSNINFSSIQGMKYGRGFFFRNTLTMESEVKHAIIKISSDDFFSIYLNGKMIYSNFGSRYWFRHGGRKKPINPAVTVDLTTFLRKGDNLLAIESSIASCRKAVGLAIAWEVEEEGLRNFSLPFLKGWKAKAYTPKPGWMLNDFNDSSWEAPVLNRLSDTGKFSGIPWGPASFNLAVELPTPVMPREFFFMTPKGYSSPQSTVNIQLFLVLYALLFFVLCFFLEKAPRPSGSFFKR